MRQQRNGKRAAGLRRRTVLLRWFGAVAVSSVACAWAAGVDGSANPDAEAHEGEPDGGERYFPPALFTKPAVAEPAVAEPVVAEPTEIQAARQEPARSAELLRSLDAVTGQVEQRIRYATDLAGRGAVYSAEAEFVRALEQIAWALDRGEPEAMHSRALSAGLRALRESDDFARGGALAGDPTVRAEAVAAHATPVLRQADFEGIAPPAAMQAYCQFAQSQLVNACGGQPVAAQALYGLGRLHALTAVATGRERPLAIPKALVLFEAAVATDPTHALAANELGVLLARFGEHERAEEVLLLSTRHSSQPEPWHNLAVVYEKQGRAEAAEAARRGCNVLTVRTQSAPATSTAAVRWVQPAEFVQAAAPELSEPTPVGGAAPAAAQHGKAPATHAQVPRQETSGRRKAPGVFHRLGAALRGGNAADDSSSARR